MILVGDFIPQAKRVLIDASLRGETVLANLEGPVCADDLEPSAKVGVHLHTRPVEWEGKWVFSLANNHMMDYGERGLYQTKLFLDANGYRYAGAGRNVAESREPCIFTENGVRIAVFSTCERQFGMATDVSSGCAAMGCWLYSAIRSVKNSGVANRVIVSCHAASEFSPWISPALREFYQSLIEAGADVIHGHHAHVPQGYEEYRGKPIFYGLGNFAVDTEMWRSNRNFLWSMAVNLHFNGEKVSWSTIPCGVNDKNSTLHIAPLEQNELEMARIYIKNANLPFSSEEACKGCWQEASVRLYPRIYATSVRFCTTLKFKYSMRQRLKMVYFATRDILQSLMGSPLGGKHSLYYSKVAYNQMTCQSHVDMIRTYLGLVSGSETDYRTEEIKCAAERVFIQ